jgi:hypothetical protein
MATIIASAFHKTHAVMAMAMYDSLYKLLPDAKFYFLCLDAESKELMSKIGLERVTCFTLEDMGNEPLLATRKDRTKTEFAMTAKSNFFSYIIHSQHVAEGDLLVLSDVDIIYFPPIAAFLEKERQDTKHSIFLTPHKFPKEKERLIPEVGFYNGGFITFRVNETSKACISKWAKQCINWCYLWHDYVNGWHTDQMYMDRWKHDFEGVLDLPDKGVNVGTWNITRFNVTQDEKGGFFIDGEPLACYHFHGLKMYYGRGGEIKPYPICVYHDQIYNLYTTALRKAYDKVLTFDPNWEYPLAPRPGILRTIKQNLTRKYLRK